MEKARTKEKPKTAFSTNSLLDDSQVSPFISSAFSVTILGFAGGKVAGRESGRMREPSGLLHKDLIWTYFAGNQGGRLWALPLGCSEYAEILILEQ